MDGPYVSCLTDTRTNAETINPELSKRNKPIRLYSDDEQTLTNKQKHKSNKRCKTCTWCT